MANSKKKDTTSIRLTEEDRVLFEKAMELEGIDALATWVVRAARLHARDIVSGGRVSLLHELETLRDSLKDSIAKLEQNGKQ